MKLVVLWHVKYYAFSKFSIVNMVCSLLIKMVYDVHNIEIVQFNINMFFSCIRYDWKLSHVHIMK